MDKQASMATVTESQSGDGNTGENKDSQNENQKSQEKQKEKSDTDQTSKTDKTSKNTSAGKAAGKDSSQWTEIPIGTTITTGKDPNRKRWRFIVLYPGPVKQLQDRLDKDKVREVHTENGWRLVDDILNLEFAESIPFPQEEKKQQREKSKPPKSGKQEITSEKGAQTEQKEIENGSNKNVADTRQRKQKESGVQIGAHAAQALEKAKTKTPAKKQIRMRFGGSRGSRASPFNIGLVANMNADDAGDMDNDNYQGDESDSETSDIDTTLTDDQIAQRMWNKHLIERQRLMHLQADGIDRGKKPKDRTVKLTPAQKRIYKGYETSWQMIAQGGVQLPKGWDYENIIVLSDPSKPSQPSFYMLPLMTDNLSFDMIHGLTSNGNIRINSETGIVTSVPYTNNTGQQVPPQLLGRRLNVMEELEYKERIGVINQLERRMLESCRTDLEVQRDSNNRLKQLQEQVKQLRQIKTGSTRQVHFDLEQQPPLRKVGTGARDRDGRYLASQIHDPQAQPADEARKHKLRGSLLGSTLSTTPQVYGSSLVTGQTLIPNKNLLNLSQTTGTTHSGSSKLMTSIHVSSMKNLATTGLGSSFMGQEQLLKRHQQSLSTSTLSTTKPPQTTTTSSLVPQSKSKQTKETISKIIGKSRSSDVADLSDQHAPPQKKQRRLGLIGTTHGRGKSMLDSTIDGLSPIKSKLHDTIDLSTASTARLFDEADNLARPMSSLDLSMVFNQLAKDLGIGGQKQVTDIIDNLNYIRTTRNQSPILYPQEIDSNKSRAASTPLGTATQVRGRGGKSGKDTPVTTRGAQRQSQRKASQTQTRMRRRAGVTMGSRTGRGDPGDDGDDDDSDDGSDKDRRDDRPPDRRERKQSQPDKSPSGSDGSGQGGGGGIHHNIINGLINLATHQATQLDRLLVNNGSIPGKLSEYGKQIEKMKANKDLNYTVRPFSGEAKTDDELRQNFVSWLFYTIKHVEQCRIEKQHEQFFVEMIAQKGLSKKAKTFYRDHVLRHGYFQTFDSFIQFLFTLYPLDDVIRFYFSSIHNLKLDFRQPLELMLAPFIKAIEIYEMVKRYTPTEIAEVYSTPENKYALIGFNKLPQKLQQRIKQHCQIRGETIP